MNERMFFYIPFYGEKTTPKAETMHEKITRYQEKADRQNASQPYRNRNKGAR